MTETSGTPEQAGQVSDAIGGNWVDKYAPPGFRPYLRLSRADRPIGTWLLLLPCWWGALLAAGHLGRFGLSELWVAVGCGLGAWLMRGAGCTWNDISDRNLDNQVERTRSRPLPSGQVSVRAATLWMLVQISVAGAILLTFNNIAILLGIASLALVAIYPFAKRFTWWPQAFLGLAFNWGALLAWAAVTGDIHPAAVALYLAGISWTLFYDTIYAHQDKEDDALIGIKSTALLFGDATHRWLRWFMVLAVLLMATAVVLALVDTRNILAVVIGLGGPWAFGWHLVWQNRVLDIDNTENCLQIFRANRNAGLFPVALFAVSLLA